MAKRPTVKDIAREANVSIATVSKIMNHKVGGYSAATRERVMQIIEERGYETNAVARGLATKSMRILGVLLPNVGTAVFGELLHGIEEVAHKHDYSIVVCNTGFNGERSLQYIKTLSANQVAGIVYGSSPFFEECFDAIQRIHMPCVLALTVSYKFQLPYVKVDDKQAAYSAVKYLIEMGHTRIAMIGSKDPIAGQPRLEGYLQALCDHGLPVNENLIIYQENYSYDDGLECMEKLLDQGEKFTALFAVSDDIAIGAMNAAHRRGIRIPEELSVIGYDNTKIARMAYPPLSTVSQPLYEMGKRAAEKLLHIIQTGKQVESSIMMHELVLRDTVKRVKMRKTKNG